MFKNKILKITELIGKIKNDITIPLISEFLDWFYENLYIHFKKSEPNHKYQKGEIYFVNLGKNIGSELNKVRPCIIFSLKSYNNKSGVIIIPIKSFKNKKIIDKFQVKIETSETNNLYKSSLVDIFYIRNISTKRINKYIGKLTKLEILEIDEKVSKMFGIKKIGN
ncbi:MAG: type II toxin-antitoxin system PemK/MazF family toxin [Candidatus Gracilibacteria bacterium]|nr:type II toxin-antitoxin system PemK/MazF family toxin [Candidatus Gracilibacteria bacterium]